MWMTLMKLRRFLRPADRLVGPQGVSDSDRTTLWRSVLFGERHIISRSLLHFERVKRPKGDADARIMKAIRLAARTKTPFENAGVYIALDGAFASVWSWDMGRLRALGMPESAWALPEPVLNKADPLQTDGFRLRELEDGFEGQLLGDGSVVASRFWKSKPRQGEIDFFMRGAAAATLLDEGRGRPSLLQQRRAALDTLIDRTKPGAVALVVALILGVPLAFQSGLLLQSLWELQVSRAQLETVATQSSEQFAALEIVRSNRATLETYRDLLDGLHPLAPVTALAQTAQAVDGALSNFRVTDDAVEAEISSPTAAPAEIVNMLEEYGSLSSVSISRARGDNQWNIRAEPGIASAPPREL